LQDKWILKRGKIEVLHPKTFLRSNAMSLISRILQWFSPLAVLGCLYLIGMPSGLLAEAPMQKTQAPGYYRMMLGKFEVTTLFDGIVELDTTLLQNISQEEIQKLLARAMIENPQKMPTSVNAYLINTGSKLILVDVGGGTRATLGRLMDNIKASGYKSDQVDAVLITHLHPDHAGGLLTPDGKPAFPKAVVYVAKAENDYWLSDAEPKNIPPEYQEHLKQAHKMVQDISEPYIKLGQWKTFDSADLPIPGIKAVPIPGHTPGHTAYEVASDGKTLIIIGDVVHFAAVQFPKSGAAVSFDIDAKQAITTREELFRRIAGGKTLVAGMHLSFPGIGRLRSDGQNTYAWVPIDYSP
jgi:glyoxylase-like metal-dependent hydrolase (beta-lactamase superfamily II)